MNQPLNLARRSGVAVLAAMGVVSWGWGQTGQNRATPTLRPELQQQLAAFVTAKQQQAEAILASANLGKPAQFDELYEQLQKGNVASASNLFEAFDGRYRNTPTDSDELGMVWQIVMESYTGWEQFHQGNPDLFEQFGRDIMAVIPAGSVYFGGTDPGRFVVTALSQSHAEGRPFFTLTQNQLADARYLKYLRRMYGSRLALPSEADVGQVFQDYLADAQARQKQNRLKPGENLAVDADGRVSVSGVGGVMAVNGLLVKCIFEKNPQRDYFIEESYPLEWLYPHLEPVGPILKIQREPLATLSEKAVENDRTFWAKHCRAFIGDWIDEATSIQDVCAFGVRVYLQNQLNSFQGSKAYVQDPYAQKTYAKLRGAIAGVYKWRGETAGGEAERRRMLKEADLGFRQALGLCPYSPETVWHYHALLKSQGRIEHARLIRQTALRFAPLDQRLREQLERLKSLRE